MIFCELNTSFVFSSASVGYNYELFNNLYAGVNSGILYLPSEQSLAIPVIPHVSSEIVYKREKQKTFLIRGGFQIPLYEMHLFYSRFYIIPYFQLTYLIK